MSQLGEVCHEHGHREMMSTLGGALPSAWKTEQMETLGANVVRACALRGSFPDCFMPFSLLV